MPVQISNPFPAEAVAAFEDNLPTEPLEQMRPATKLLTDYLAAYVVSDARFGAAAGVIGAFGDGKTHLLASLRSEALALRTEQCSVLYAKADLPSLLGVYRQFMSQLDRKRIFDLRLRALKMIAIARSSEAKATESVAPRIEASSDLIPLSDEGNIDLDRIGLLFDSALTARGISPAFIAATNAIGLAQIGDAAYRWITGDDRVDPKAIGLLHTLPQDGASEDDSGLRGMTYIAALHQLAGVPLLLLVDQLEVLVPEMSKERIAKIASSIKKMIEQVTRESTLLVMAGTPAVWGRLPPDAIKRITPGQFSRLGLLTVRESGALVRAYARIANLSFSDSIIELLHDLSGGSPRELLRIAHQAVNASGGDVENREVVIASAESTGTIEERTTRAKAETLTILMGYGRPTVLHLLESDLTVDFALERDGELALAVELMPARTKIAEARAAKRIATILHRLESVYPGVALIVVPIGYSTAELAELIAREAVVVPFEEPTFRTGLSDAIESLISGSVQAVPLARGEETESAETSYAQASALESSTAEPFLTRYDTLRKDLNRVEQEREKETEVVATAFKQNLAEIDATERAGAGRTRQELVEDIDRIRDALDTIDVKHEYELMRSLLISNELGARDDFVNQAGGLYMDLVNYSRRKQASQHPAFSLGDVDNEAIAMRREILLLLVSRLRGRETHRETMIRMAPLRGLIVGAAVALGFILMAPYIVARFLYWPFTSSGFSTVIAVGLIVGVVVGFAMVLAVRGRTDLQSVERAARRLLEAPQ